MKISQRDWVRLSAYLDGELSQRDASRLEARIGDNPAFQAALEDLRTVKTVLSQAPRLAVPRNFALRRSQVESPQQRSPVLGYRLAAAALSFLFIGVVVFDVGSWALKGGLPASLAPRDEEVMLEAAVEEIEAAAPLEKEAAAAEEAVPAAEMEEAPLAPESLEAEREANAPEGMGGEDVEDAEEADQVLGTEEVAYGDETQDLGSALDQDEEPTLDEDQIPPDGESLRAGEKPGIPWMRILEITFGLGAVGFGTAAWLKRRKDRKS